MNNTADIAEITKSVDLILDDARDQLASLHKLKFDTSHVNAGYTIRFVFDFNVLRTYLYPLLDGAFGTKQFYTSLFSASFFFEHKFERLLLQPYFIELESFLKYCRAETSRFVSSDWTSVSGSLQRRYPYVRQILDSKHWTADTRKYAVGAAAVEFARAVKDGSEHFAERKREDCFPSVHQLIVKPEVLPDFRKSSEFSAINDALRASKIHHNELREKHQDGHRKDNDSGKGKKPRLTSDDERRLVKDAEAIYTVQLLNEIADQTGSKEMFVFITEDEVVRSVLDTMAGLKLKKRMMDAEVPEFYSASRDSSYLALYLLLYRKSSEEFSSIINVQVKLIEQFLASVEQLATERLVEWASGKPIKEATKSRVREGYEAVREHLIEFDTAAVAEKGAILNAPGVKKALERFEITKSGLNSRLREVASFVVSNQPDLAKWFARLNDHMDATIRMIEIELARHAIRFDRSKLGYYYPTKYTRHATRPFRRRADKILELLSRLEPSQTADAIGLIHKLQDKYPDIPDTTVLLARSYYVQGLWVQGLRKIRQIMNDSDAAESPEIKFVASRLYRRVASLPGQPKDEYKKKARELCEAADRLSRSNDPRITRELGYLKFDEFLEKYYERLPKGSEQGKRIKSRGGTEIPESPIEFDLIIEALKYAKRSRWLIDRSADEATEFDTSSLRVIVFNDIAYFQYALAHGKLIYSDLTEWEFGRWKTLLRKVARTHVLSALRGFGELSQSQKSRILPIDMVETLARVIIAEIDYLEKSTDSPATKENRRNELIKLTAYLSRYCIELDPDNSCSLDLMNAVTSRLGSPDSLAVAPELQEILSVLPPETI